MARNKLINELAVIEKSDEFRMSLHNRYFPLTNEDISAETMNGMLRSIITERAGKVDGKFGRHDIGKLFQETEDLIENLQKIKASNPKDGIELAELSKLIKKRNMTDNRKCNMERIEPAVKNEGPLKAVKMKLGIDKNQMYSLRDKQSRQRD